MPTGRRLSAFIIIFLVAAIVAGGVFAWLRYPRNQPIEISLPSPPTLKGEVYVDGAVSSPGWYPLKADDSLESIVLGAGGPTGAAAPGQFKLYVPKAGETAQTQRVNLNQAEAWLLQALPGIGETRAKAIVDYRRRNGPFRSTTDLLKVEGIGATTYERLKDLVTVGD